GHSRNAFERVIGIFLPRIITIDGIIFPHQPVSSLIVLVGLNGPTGERMARHLIPIVVGIMLGAGVGIGDVHDPATRVAPVNGGKSTLVPVAKEPMFGPVWHLAKILGVGAAWVNPVENLVTSIRRHMMDFARLATRVGIGKVRPKITPVPNVNWRITTVLTLKRKVRRKRILIGKIG